MGGELVAVVAIAGGVGDDALARAAHPVERLADIGDRGLAAADEDVEIERDRPDPVVGRGGVERADHLGERDIRGSTGPPPSAASGSALGRLLDDRAGEVEPERAARARCRL